MPSPAVGLGERLETDPERTQRMLACLGDRSRFRVIAALVKGERCVTDLALEIGLSQSCTSRHLQALLRQRLVCRRRDGKRVLFSICTDETIVRELIGLALASVGMEAAGAGIFSRPPQRARPRPPGAIGRAAEPRAPAPAASSGSAPDSESSAHDPANDTTTAFRDADMEDYLL